MEHQKIQMVELLKDFLQMYQTARKEIKIQLGKTASSHSRLLYFQKMLDLSKNLSLKELSMGMSADYMLAVNYKSTYLRIGSSIFGQIYDDNGNKSGGKFQIDATTTGYNYYPSATSLLDGLMSLWPQFFRKYSKHKSLLKW